MLDKFNKRLDEFIDDTIKANERELAYLHRFQLMANVILARLAVQLPDLGEPKFRAGSAAFRSELVWGLSDPKNHDFRTLKIGFEVVETDEIWIGYFDPTFETTFFEAEQSFTEPFSAEFLDIISRRLKELK